MILFFILLFLIIILMINTIRYFRAYARLKSHVSYKEAAEREMSKLRSQDPRITCDYCGATIDTSQYKVCPQCGADYAKDEEWIHRYQPDQGWVDEKAEQEAEREIHKAEAEARKYARRIRRILLFTGISLLLLIALVCLVTYLGHQSDYAKNEELNSYSYEHYEKSGDQLVGDTTLLDAESVHVEITGIYEDDSWTKLEYHIVNQNSYAVRIHIEGLAINGYAHTFAYMYPLVRKNTEITIYERLYESQPIESMIFGEIYISDEHYDRLYESEGDKLYKTSAYIGSEPVLSDGVNLYENEWIRVQGLGYDEQGRYDIEIQNKTEDVWDVTCDDARVSDVSFDVYGMYQIHIPAGCICNNKYVYGSDDAYTNRSEEDTVRVNFTFTNEEKPELSFKTGYIELQPYTAAEMTGEQ